VEVAGGAWGAERAGNADTASRSDHVHADKPPVNEPVKTTLAGSGPSASLQNWLSDNPVYGGLVLRVHTRTFYDTSGSVPELKGFYRDLTFDRSGRLFQVSGENHYNIATPKLGF